MRAWTATVTSLAVTLAVAGCGSSHPVSAAQLLASIDAICVRHDTAASFDPIVGESSEVKLAASKLLAVERRTLVELGRLTVPASMEPGWKRFAAARQNVIKLLIELSAHGGTAVSIQPVGAAIEAMRGAAREAGLTECTHEY